ncbi:methyltransferase type 12 [Nesterenkonia sp. AN1]|uniref:23S rRNA m(1)G-748 methyltransferase n=1 Tax=Nesterenkonia aurantiaca TaxID=1436010 RepID=A0A4R7G0J0_9MICC|nr:methyltransferase type 12 [Nesterenkonia sp. AN1]TDS84675.1 23S rRNA m(1)G-748 methyltransferase [Nesterenkonia aurantiaca]
MARLDRPAAPVPSDSLDHVTPPWPLTCPACAAPLEATLKRESPASSTSAGLQEHARTTVNNRASQRIELRRRESSPSALQALSCPAGHRFDAARQGYVNLLSGRGTRFTADSAQMIMARESVQDAGIFAALSKELARILTQHLPQQAAASPAEPALLLDCGAGTGHYLHQLLEVVPQARGIALDLSTAGLKRAARHPRTLALAWDLWQPLPLASDSVDLLLDIFAPRNVGEYARVLRPNGLAVVVTPGDSHLIELRSAGMLEVPGQKLHQLQEQMTPSFGALEQTTQVTAAVPVDAGLAADLVFMGPAGHHHDYDTLRQSLQAREVSQVTVHLDVSLWRG